MSHANAGKLPLTLPAGLAQKIADLYRDVVKYRTDSIEHPSEPRLGRGGIAYEEKTVAIYPVVMYPRPGEVEKYQQRSGDLNALYALITDYAHEMLDFLEQKFAQSVLAKTAASPPAVSP